jgi:ADP-ribose pyrophosphatase YjhB (NUDIX family)
MYKVFVLQGEIRLVSVKSKSAQKSDAIQCDSTVPDWPVIKAALGQSQSGLLVLACEEPKKCWRNLKKRFGIIHASGGLVINKEGKVLMIKRLGLWDLPKGKLEKDEDLLDCAIREVEEECAVYGLGVTGTITVTYHVMRRNKNKYLKVSKWYMMRTDQTVPGIPQLEEGINKVEWVPMNKVKKKLKKSWPSVREVFKESGLEY